MKTKVTIEIDASIAEATNAYTLGLYAEQQFKATHHKDSLGIWVYTGYSGGGNPGFETA